MIKQTRPKVISVTADNRLIVTFKGINIPMGRGRAKLEDQIIQESIENLDTGNQILDKHLIEQMQNRTPIAQYLQVINEDEIAQITEREDISNIQPIVAERIKKHMIPIYHRKAKIVLSKLTPEAHYFSKIHEYCIAIGQNSYK